jgi:OOP family OmpA-OmpF porin
MARWIVLAGVTALFVIGYFATSETQSKNDGLGRRNAHTIAASLQKQAEGALKRIGADHWASVIVDGQTAILNGEAPTDSDRQDALDAVKASEWSGGKWIGGITVVRNATTLAEPTKPYEWMAVLGEPGSVRLSGHVPGQKHRRAIKAAAQRLFSKQVVDNMTIAQGAPTGPWTDTAIWALAQLSQLTNGEVHFKDKTVLVLGTAPTAMVQAEIQQAAESKIAKPYKGKTEIRAVSAFDQAAPASEPAAPPAASPETPPAAAATLATAPAPASATAAPAGGPAAPAPPPQTPPAPTTTPALTTPPPESTEPAAQHDGLECQKILDSLMVNNTIAFASDSTEIRSVAHEMLNKLARAAAKCPLKVRITGHTDATETDDLSQKRADAVARYLAGKGVARKRIRATGVGSEQPIGNNDTASGQAKNRRTEITVTN